MSRIILSTVFIIGAYAHGVILMAKGANGVNAPGTCDTGLIRDAEIDRGQFGPLGWTQGGGNCKPDAAIGQYIGLGTAPKYTGGRTFTSPDKKEDDLDAQASAGSPKCRAAYDHHADLLFGKREPSANPVGDAIGIGLSLPQIGFLGLGGNRTLYPEETIVGDYTGYGKDNGLPTTDDDNTISVVYRQINQDGPGPKSAAVESTSAGTDRKAFKTGTDY